VLFRIRGPTRGGNTRIITEEAKRDQGAVLEVTLRSWYQARRSDAGSSEAGKTTSRDPTHKARWCEVGGLTLYSRDQLSKRNIFKFPN
jgi:hypothetical protein